MVKLVDADALYAGSTVVDEVYSGSTLVYGDVTSDYAALVATAKVHFKLDDTAADTVCVNDGVDSGADGNGAYVNMTASSGTSAGLGTEISTGTSMTFDGVTEHMRGPNVGLGEGNDQTLSCIATTTDSGGYLVCIAEVNTGGFGFFVHSGGEHAGKLELVVGTQSFGTYGDVVNDGTPHVITVVYTNADDTARAYVDGVLSITMPVSSGVFTADKPIMLACKSNTDPATFLHMACTLDEVMYFHSALDAAKIATLASPLVATSEAPSATNLTQYIAYTTGDTTVAITDIVVTDITPGETITAQLTLADTATGALSTGTYGSTTSTYVAGTGVWEAVGTVTDVNAALADVAFEPVVDNAVDTTITTHIEDVATTGPMDGVITLDVSPAGPAPTGYFVSPTGAGLQDGTEDNEWPFSEIRARTITAGETVWLRGGDYTGANTPLDTPGNGSPTYFRLDGGTLANPVVVRSYPGEWARLDLWHASNISGDARFDIDRDNITFREIEFYSSSNLQRWTTNSSPDADDSVLELQRGALFNSSDNVRFINCVMHDLQYGVSDEDTSEGGGIYNCIIYNNGWQYDYGSGDRGMAHGVYARNNEDLGYTYYTKGNMLFDNMHFNFHIFGTTSGVVDIVNMEFVDNVAINCGKYGANLMIGGYNTGSDTDNITVDGNHTYQTTVNVNNHNDRMGWSWTSNVNSNWTVTDNYFATGQLKWVQADWSTGLTASGNVVIGEAVDGDNVDLTTELTTYGIATPVARASATGTVSKAIAADYTDTHRYPGGFGFVSIYNWDGAGAVSVDLSAILSDGANYKIWHIYDVENFMNNTSPLESGVFDVLFPDISITIGNKTAPTPSPDLTGHFTAHTMNNEYGAFIVATY